MTRLTAAELNITQPEYDALIWVRDALDPDISDHGLPEWMIFDMDTWSSLSATKKLGCGTVCCIGGSMEMHMAGFTSKNADYKPTLIDYTIVSTSLQSVTEEQYGSDALNALFFDFYGVKNDRVAAVAAIDRFFEGNTENPWLAPDQLDDDDD